MTTIRKTITLDLEGMFPAIKDDSVDNVTRELNDSISDEPNAYSAAQVKRAMWTFLQDKIDSLLENIEETFIDDLSKMRQWEQDRLLGEPELNKRHEAILSHGDELYDAGKGN